MTDAAHRVLWWGDQKRKGNGIEECNDENKAKKNFHEFERVRESTGFYYYLKKHDSTFSLLHTMPSLFVILCMLLNT